MGGLLWLLAAVGVLGTVYPLSEWTDFLVSCDASLPLTSPTNSKICYHFDLSQTCAGEAIGHLLAQPAVADVTTWTATEAVCNALLDEQRLYAEYVASSVFGPAITSAAAVAAASKLTKFELMVQSWVLRVGHYELTQTHTAFVDALKSISDWTTVECYGTDFLYDGVTITKPGFVKRADCKVLGALYPTPDCTKSDCSLKDGGKCCLEPEQNNCCNARINELLTYCATAGCPFYQICCNIEESSACCVA